MATLEDGILALGGAFLLNQRIAKLERLALEAHALLSARITLNWTAVLPVNADVSAVFLPDASYGCTLLDVTVDSSGVAPIIITRFRLLKPLAFSSRAQLFGSHLIEQGGLVPPNPIVGVITFPASLEQPDPFIVQIVNVVGGPLLTPGTRSVWDVHMNLRRGDLQSP